MDWLPAKNKFLENMVFDMYVHIPQLQHREKSFKMANEQQQMNKIYVVVYVFVLYYNEISVG